MGFKGTKGNWGYIPSTSLYHPQVSIGGRKIIVNAFKNHEEQDANAKLIAAAPELLNCLNHVKYCLETNQPMGELTLTDITKVINKALK